MPPILGLRDARLAFADKLLFESLSLYLNRGDRAALVGANGTGKSTLLKCLLGTLEIDDGERVLQPGTRIAWVPQEAEVPDGETLARFVARADDALDGPESERRDLAAHVAEAALSRTGLDPALTGGSLSGGEARRAVLARALARDPDVLLLDEPTNHLDIAAIEALEGALKGFAGAVLVISHDRAFLESVSKATLWLQRRHLLRMEGPFRNFEAWSEEIIAREIRSAERLKKRIARETRWLQRGITARRRRNEGRLRRLIEMREARRQRQVGRPSVAMAAAEGPPASRLVADVIGVSKSFKRADGGETVVVRHFTTRIMKGDRVGILGPNGSGKTTLLRMLTGEIAPDSGRIKLGGRTEFAYFAQSRGDLDPTLSPWRFLCPNGGDQVNVRGHLRHVVGYLKEFLFDEDDAVSAIATLSGGQRNRLMLARVLAQPSNVLVLDEPTNDLDMDTLDKLQETLDSYEGTLIVVSHDRDFVDKLVTSVIVTEGEGRVVEYVGGYGDYLRQCGTQAETADTRPHGPKPPRAGGGGRTAPSRHGKGKLSFKDQRELDRLPERMEALAAKIKMLEARLSDPGLYARDAEAFADAAARREAAVAELGRLEERWLDLEGMRESMEGRAG